MDSVSVVKANGDIEPFRGEKLMQSLVRSGASKDVAEGVLNAIEKSLKEGMSTASIYRRAFTLLHHREKTAALRYSLRKALTELGPSGFPFESFLMELFREQGYEVKKDQIIKGKCVKHEVDIVATNKEKHVLAEIKFHNERGIKTDLKVALYVSARFEDIPSIDGEGHKREGWLITNTKFSSSAIQYGMCKNFTLIGWNFPSKGNLKDMIEESGLHPLTCLSSLTKSQKNAFLSRDVVLCRDVLKHQDILDTAGITEGKLSKIKEEINMLCCAV
jgi:hypothetical protein